MDRALTFGEYAEELRAFIRSQKIDTYADGQRTNGANEWRFNELALDLFKLQFVHNQAYRKLCGLRRVAPAEIAHWSQIAAVPAAAFKELEMTALPEARRTRVFYSSGTTEQKRSKHFHSPDSLVLYEDSLLPWFRAHFVADLHSFIEQGRLDPPGKMQMLFLTPPPAMAPNSSLVHMFETVRRELASDDSVFLGVTEPNGNWAVETSRFLTAIRHAGSSNVPVGILGTAFQYVTLLNCLAETNIQLPQGSRVLETGGYKGRSRELARTDLYDLIARRWGVHPTHIISEYGMSELSSQAYDLIIRDDKQRDSGVELERLFTFPPWARVQIVSPETGAQVNEGEMGLIRIFDLANAWSVLAVQTEDLGLRRGEGFKLAGRAERSEPRGCSLMTTE